MSNKPHRWKAWAILLPDEQLYRFSLQGPESEPINRLIAMGCFVIPVIVTEELEDKI